MKKLCPKCQSEMIQCDAPLWHEIKIPFTGIILLFGKWGHVYYCPDCDIDNSDQQYCQEACEAAYREGIRDCFVKAKYEDY
jgi:hypothetical protein